MQNVPAVQGPLISPYSLTVTRLDQGTATMTFYYNGVAQFSATRAGWDDAIPFGSGTFFGEQSNRFGFPMWDFVYDPQGREAVQLHVAQPASSGNPISWSSYGCLVADGAFLNAVSSFIAGHGQGPLRIEIVNDFPVSLSCSTSISEVDEGSRIAITVTLDANSTGISKDIYVKIGLAPGSTASEADFKVLANPVPDTEFDDLRSLVGVANAAKASLKFQSGLYVKIPAGQTSGQIVVDILQDDLEEKAENLIFRIDDYAINSPSSSGAERLYSDYKQTPKILIDGGSTATVTIGEALTIDDEPIVASGSNFTFVRIGKVIPGKTYTYNFEAYGIPDAIAIFDSTQTYINTGLSSGLKSGSITIPKNSDGFITVRVQGNPDPNTAWDLFVGPASSLSQMTDDAVFRVSGTSEGEAESLAAAAAGQLAVNDDATFQLTAGGSLQLTASLVAGKYYSLAVIVPDGGEMSPEALVAGSVPAESFNLESTFVNSNVVGFIQADRAEDIVVTISEAQGDAGEIRVVFREVDLEDLNAFTVGLANRIAQESGDAEAEGIAFTIYRLGDIGSASTVSWRLVPDGDNPVSAADFGGALPSGTVSFAAGRIQEYIQLFPTVDPLAEAPEGFRIELFAPVDARLADVAVHGQGASVAGLVVDGFDAPIVDLGTRFADELFGGPVGDTLSGGDGHDAIEGKAGDDRIDGGSGNDRVIGGGGADQIRGGDGRDRFVYSALSDSAMAASDTILDFESGADILDASALNPRNFSLLELSPGVQLLELNTQSGSLFIVIHGAIGADDIRGGTLLSSGNGDTLIGGVFGDLIVGGIGADQLLGGAGSDRLVGNEAADSLHGQPGDDFLTGGAGHDLLAGGAGIDRAGYYQTDANLGGVTVSLLLQGQAQNTGSQGKDSLSDIEQLSGTPFADTLTGDGRANWLWGSAANISDGLFSFTNDDRLDGRGGDDLLTVGIGDHVLIGGPGVDTVSFTESGAPEPALFVSLAGQGASQFTGAGSWNLSEIENLSGGAGGDTLIGEGGVNILAGAGGGDELFGAGGDDLLLGDGEIAADLGSLGYSGPIAIFEDGPGNGDDLLDGGPGADRMIGGFGDDIYVIDQAGDQAVEEANAGIDTIRSSISLSLAGRPIEHLTLTGTAAIDGSGNAANNDLIGNSAANRLEGAAGNDLLDGKGGNDVMEGGVGNDAYFVDAAGDQVVESSAAGGIDSVSSSIGYSLGNHVENLTLTGAGAIDGNGNDLANLIIGNTAANRLSGGLGNDSLRGGGGGDTLAGGGGGDLLDGEAGADEMRGGAGDDSYVVDHIGDKALETSAADGADVVTSSVSFTLGAHVETLILTGAGAIGGTGNALANLIVGNAAANVLNGGGGGDTLRGGGGNDTYLVDHVGDQVVESNAAGGTDLVRSSVGFTLGAGVENLILVGTAAVNGAGNSLTNVLTGNIAANVLGGGLGNDTLNGAEGGDTLDGGAGNDRLDGGSGQDRMIGGAGNDSYFVDNVSDQAVESSATGGVDLVSSSVSFTLGANVENLTLTGAGPINGVGNNLANILTGNGAANRLNGGAGADTMNGWGGDDSYFVDHAGDQVAESKADGGTDLVSSAVSFTLGANIENLTLTGTAANGTGNLLANVIIGNAAANRLDGGGGADTMIGGNGNDTFIVGHAADKAVEGSATGGIDTVQSSVSFTLGANVEHLLLTGAAAIGGVGNNLSNMLTGNGAANRLDGGAGADTMTGWAGDDTYVVDAAGDKVVENKATGGTDLVESAVSFTLGANVENLTLTGTAANGAGNGLANEITGNAAANVLRGAAGADTLRGGGGNDTLHGGDGGDTLRGGDGSDSFMFDRPLGATNIDHIADLVRGADRIVLENAVFRGLAAGALSADALVVGTAATTAAHRIIYDPATGALLYDPDGTGAAAATPFAIIDTLPAALAANDFQVI